jgi:hypothetical protein
VVPRGADFRFGKEPFISTFDGREWKNVLIVCIKKKATQTVKIRLTAGERYKLTTTAVNGSITPSDGSYGENSVLTLIAKPKKGHRWMGRRGKGQSQSH